MLGPHYDLIVRHPIWLTATANKVPRHAQRNDDGDSTDLTSFVPHNLRRSARTRLRAIGTPVDVCEHMLGHALAALLNTYDHGEFLDERREALAALERHIRAIVGK
jgi:integrase